MLDFRDPGKIFSQSFPADIQLQLAQAVRTGYADRTKHANLPESQMHDSWPHLRRGLIEKELKAIATRHRSLTATDCRNPKGTSNYVRIDAGNIILTESKVRHAQDIPRPAAFRETLARRNAPLLNGFEDLEPTPDPNTKLCAILIHSEDPADPLCPLFIDIVFPSPDGKDCLGPRIHLLPLLSVQATDVEQVEDDLPNFGFRDDIAGEEKA